MSRVRKPLTWRSRAWRWLGVLTLVVVALMVGSAIRLAKAPVALPDWVLTQVEMRVNRDLVGARASLGGAALGYDLQAQALRLVVRDAALTADGQEDALIRVPQTQVALDGPALIRGRIRPRMLRADGLTLLAVRDAAGRWSVALGAGGGAAPDTWPDALALLDITLAAPVLGALSDVALEGLEIAVSDAITGLSDRVVGRATLARDGATARLDLAATLPALGADVTASLTRDAAGARAEAAVDGITLGRLAQALPQVPALTLVRGGVRAQGRFALDAQGAPGPLDASLALTDVASTDRPRLRSDRMALGVRWLPGDRVIAITDMAASSDEFALNGTGQVILEDGLTGAVQGQLHLTDLRLDPEAMFERQIAFDQGLIEARLTQAPLGLHLGQAMLTGPSGTARATARLTFPPGGVAGAVEVAIPRMAVEDLRPLWPQDLTPGVRGWFVRNLLDGTVRDVAVALRLAPGAAPRTAASLAFEGGALRYMRSMPPALDARGAVQFSQGRATVRVDAGRVAVGEGPGIDLAGTRLVLPDALSRPPEGRLALKARGAIGDVLELLDNRPFRLLDRIRKTRDLATGRAEADVEVVLPLRPGNTPADIAWSVRSDLIDVVSDRIVPGRRIEADVLTLRADSASVEIGGAMTFEGVPFDGAWRQALPPPATAAPDPTAPPPPPLPLPQPGRVQGTASVTPDGLARLGIALDAVDLSGRAEVAVDITLEQGAPPRLVATSGLRGMAARLPAIGWSKGQAAGGALTVEATLGAVPEVTRLVLDAPGLEAEGRITLTDGTLGEARFSRIDTGWFRGPLTLTGRGAGRAPGVAVGAGRADLRVALDRLRTAGGDGGGAAPITVALDQLQITDAIALTGLRARLRGGSGEFSGGVNGGEVVSGVLAPRDGGTVVQVQTDDAGAVLRATGLFRDARGGSMTLTLQSTQTDGVLRGSLRGGGLRVRDAPALASLLQTLSVVGLLEQLAGQGLPFTSVEADFTLSGGDIRLARASAVGPSMSITADGVYDADTRRLDMQGVVSPIYFVNGLFGALFSRRDEGLFGFTYRMRGAVADPQVSVNPLSILTPGRFRDIFRAPAPSQ